MADASDSEPTPIQTTRRTFIVWYLAGLLGALTLAAVAPLVDFIIPAPAKGQKRGPQTVHLDKPVDAIAEGEAVQFQAAQGTAFVMADGGGDNSPGDLAFGGYVANVKGQPTVYAINCPHLGCSFNFDQPSGRFKCPCHGSQFAIDGSVLHGPATAPLSHLSWSQTGDPGVISIDGLTLGEGA